MKKIIFLAAILLFHLTLPGCYGDLADVMQSKDNLLKKTLVLLALPPSGSSSSSSSGGPIDPPPPSGPSISQYGITWTFDKEYEYGQFANGDYWVIGPVRIVKITPESKAILGTTTISGFTPGSGPNASIRIMNGSVINPAPGNVQAYDNEMYRWVPSASSTRLYGANYNSSLNVALDVSSSNPLTLPAGTSLISTISYKAGNRPQLKTAAVLTVLNAPAPAGSFRPPYCGTDKSIKFNKSRIHYTILSSLSLTGVTSELYSAANGQALVAKLKRVWIDYFNEFGGGTQYTSPLDNMPWYGREYEAFTGEASLLLNASSPDLTRIFNITKEDLAIGLIQIGIDNYGVLTNGGFWVCNGGLNIGRKWPILLAGVLLDDNSMKNIASFNFTPVQYTIYGKITTPFAEEQTVFYVGQRQYDATHVAYWGDASHTPYVGPTDSGNAIAYATTDFGLPEWGYMNNPYPIRNNKWWGASYRPENGCGNAGNILAALILESTASTKTLWGNNAMFDYMDRYMSIESKNSFNRQTSNFNENMWDKYRAQYGSCYSGLSSGERQYGSCTAVGVVK